MIYENLRHPVDKSGVFFRAKGVSGEWVYGHYLFIQDGIGEEHCIWNNRTGKGDPIEIRTLCRFAGFYLNDIPVFEYDVLEREGFWSYYVKFEDSAFRLIPCELVQAMTWEHHIVDDMDRYYGRRIVGNIIDSPEFIIK